MATRVQPQIMPRPDFGRGFIALENSRQLRKQKDRHQILDLTAPDGIESGQEITLSGGMVVEASSGNYAPIDAEPGTLITPYKLVLNGVVSDEWFLSPGILPAIEPGDTIQAQDAFGRLSNIITAPTP